MNVAREVRSVNDFQSIQLILIKSCGLFCIFLTLFLLLAKNYNKKRRITLVLIEIWSSILLFSDMLSYQYDGKSGRMAFFMVRISNFMVYLSIVVVVIAFAFYLKSWLEELDGNEKIDEWINYIVVILYCGIALLIVSQTNNIYYSFDANNTYVREKYFAVSYASPFLAFALIIALTIMNYKKLMKQVANALIVIEIIPIVMAIVQVAFNIASLLNIAFGICAILLFSMSVLEQNYMLNIVSATEMRTGLPNSYGYFRWISILRKKESITKYNSYYFEIKDFNFLNRKYGIDTVLEIQKKYHEILYANITDKEIVANLGGNYYVAMILKEHTDKFVDMMNGVEVEVENNGETIKEVISTIVGGYNIDDENVSMELIIGNASMAIGVNKYSGGKKIFIDDEIKAKMMKRSELESQIPIAMENEEFRPYYQPKMSASRNELVGAEALVRWVKKDGEVVPPVAFIPLLEHGKEICTMDFYMLKCVCRDLAEWIEKGLNPPKISVNLSRKNLANPYLVQELTEVIDSYKVPHSLIEVEITETVDEYPLEELNKFVDYLHRRGITVAIDDFGTGSSSMNLLRAVDFDILKIDKSFVDNREERDRKILKRIITIAKDIGINIIAEGVETKEQLEELKELGCDSIQGFYYDKPLPKHEFEKRLN